MKTIFDIGFCNGFDTVFYLHQGFKVVAVDANTKLIDAAKEQFSSYIKSGQLILINKGIANIESTQEFFISQNREWSSFSKKIADRCNLLEDSIEIQTTTLPTLFEKYGVPYYCKIDIEGADIDALNSLKNTKNCPQFLSVESECIGEKEVISQKDATLTLDLLHELGYNQFKLVEQNSLSVLKYKEPFYTTNLWFRAKRKLERSFAKSERIYLNNKFGFDFKHGCTGVFGEFLRGKWYDYNTAKALLLEKRQEYFNFTNPISYGFWCDWHAKKE